MEKKKKICFVVSAPGTARNFFKEPIKLLAEHFDVYLAANIKSEDELADMRLAGYRSIPIERRPNYKTDLKALKELTRYFKDEQFDCVHSMSKKASLLCSIAARRAKIPYRFHHFTGQMWHTMKGLRRAFYKYMDVFIVKSDTHMLVDGVSQKEYLEEQKVLKKNQATVLGKGSICGVNVDRFKPDADARQRIREEVKVDADTVVFIFMGRLKREKGIYELLAAYNAIAPSCPKSLLLLVGTDEESCMSRICEYPNLKDGENVIYYGHTSRPEDLLNAGDIYVLPTYREGFGLSVLEASCVGLPVICSDTYGVRDTMVDNETGLRCKTYDVDTLAVAMKELYNSPEKRKEFGKNGIKYVHDNFSASYVCQEWLNYYLNNLK
ncbi:MAG: glycosyltransferase family 4 protein [Bacteroidales bacterium]|nr:glycosyltransferase family 4 protein [Bacteroidales bacterium]